MNLQCLNTIITDNLAVHIDLSNVRSWNLNTGLTVISLTKWKDAVSGDIILDDFGLTAFDNGRVDNMSDSLTITQNNNKLVLYRVGYNNETGDTSYSGYTITPITGSSVGNHFYLDGGYLQGFYKLYGYDYEILPPRYNNGITVEVLLEILSESQGIFFYMGTRAEDKYNPYFSGETEIINTTAIQYGGKEIGYQYEFSGITTSEGNYLNSYEDTEVKLSSFNRPEESDSNIMESQEQTGNLKNNIIAFEITDDLRIKYKYIDENGNLIQNESPTQITRVGWTLITIVYKPYDTIGNYDKSNYQCYSRRTGDLMFYTNGRLFWKIEDFNEFYFVELLNHKEKQSGVPFNISLGGGSFGLKHSWHYENMTGSTIVQDERKSGLFVERYFDSGYFGNIQKLRIYDTALYSNEVLHNAYIEASSNVNYGMTVSKGGRLIQSYVNVPYLPQDAAGSDIRKSIRYRNPDGTYKDLYQMLDIKVVVKSRNNPTVELIKFKKTVEAGWNQLIWMNDTTYDFIVPDEITSLHPNEILFAEIKFEWTDPDDTDLLLEKIFVTNITSTTLLDNTVKNY